MTRTVTLSFLFTDIEGSTARWESQRVAMTLALQRHDALLRAAIEGQGGQVFKTIGDAFCAAFPQAAAALAAAIAAQRSLATEDWRQFGADFAELRVRMGLHHGQAEARGGDYFGPALNRCARLMAAGHGGQLLLSRAAKAQLADALPPGCRLRDLGEHRLKDLRHSERLFQVVVEGLPDIAKAPQSAVALDARDRITVFDPAAPGSEDAAAADADGAPLVVQRTVPETLAAILAVLRGDLRSLVLTPEQVIAAARHRPADLTAYRLGRVAEWNQPRYRLDGRFVALTLLLDQGEDASQGRWAEAEERYQGLGELLARTPDPAIAVLGPPGAGKSTLLRRLELDQAITCLRDHAPPEPRTAQHPSPDGGDGADGTGPVTFFIQLNQYRAVAPGGPPPAPGAWLAAEWAERYPALPPLDDLLAEGRMLLLLDALNEMPTTDEREFRARVGLWKDWLLRLVQTRPGNRVVFSCRSLDYASPLSSPALRVPQVRIEPLADDQVASLLSAYSPLRGGDIWRAIRGSPQLEALRAPFFLNLLVEQVEATGELAEDRAGLFTGFVRQALRRELERGNPLATQEALLTARDQRRITQWQWKDAYELPERGAFFPKLSALAYGMQSQAADGGASQVRLDIDAALDLLDNPAAEDMVQAGLAIAVLDEDPVADELLYRHQLLQEYFAARILAISPEPALVAAPWRAEELSPSLAEALAALAPADSLPPLPQTGWEETLLLAAAMAADKTALLQGLSAVNLPLAGRAAGQPAVHAGLDDAFLNRLRQDLLARSRDPEADLRHRIACAEAVGQLGDPRWERRSGPWGAYLLPPLASLPGRLQPLGDDAAIDWSQRGSRIVTEAHVPRHLRPLAAFAIGRYPVTNAEYACFVDAGGYADERWWPTEAGRRWLRGELANEGAKENNRLWRTSFLADPSVFERLEAEGAFASEEALERWRLWLSLDDQAFEAAIEERWRGQAADEPLHWRDSRWNGPNLPVVGVCWYEAQAYCNWLRAQTGRAFRLVTELEWEAAARGPEGRRYAWGSDFIVDRANSSALMLRRTTPVGVLPQGDTPEAISDLCGNVDEWTSSLWGLPDIDSPVPPFAYPYDAADGREDPEAPPALARILRGGCWNNDPAFAQACYRNWAQPYVRTSYIGFRVAVDGPASPMSG